jgi:hypothetical protein
MLRKHGRRNIASECLVIMCAVAAATIALTFSLVARDAQIRSQRALGVTYTWTWTNNADAGEKTGAQQAMSSARLPQVGSLTGMILMSAAAALVGGIVFSLLKTQRPVPSASSRRLARQCDVFQADMVRIEREKLLDQSTNSDEPYPHHETHPGSPGEDQGQLTSHLPGSTPFFEDVEPAIHPSLKF